MRRFTSGLFSFGTQQREAVLAAAILRSLQKQLNIVASLETRFPCRCLKHHTADVAN